MTGTEKPPQKEGSTEYTADDGKDVLFKSIKNSSDPHIRRYALYFLSQLKDQEHIGYFGALLRDPDKGVREQAMRALAASGQPGFDILSGLVGDSDWKVRYRACEALGLMHIKEALPLLVRALGDEKDHVRYMAAKSLGLIGEPDAELPLIDRINDENVFVRKMVAITLGKLGGKASVGALRKQLDIEHSGEVKKAILESISQIPIEP
jgi:HEAT repeat protein